MQGGVKRLDLSFQIILQEMNSNLKNCSITQLASEAVREVRSFRRAHWACTVCQGPHQEEGVQTCMAPNRPLGNFPVSFRLCRFLLPRAICTGSQRSVSYFTCDSTGEGLCRLYLCIIQNRCSRNETGPQGEGKRRGEKRCWVGSWRLEKVTDFLCKKSVLKNTRFGVM